MDEVPRVQDALEAAFRNHYVALVRVSLLLCGNRETAEDLVQEAFVRAGPVVRRLQVEEVRPYLRRSVINLWKNYLRRRSVERRMLFWQSFTDGGANLEDQSAMWQALMRLSARQRACLVLRYYEELPESEIARLLGCSVGAVKTHVSRGLERMRKEYGP